MHGSVAMDSMPSAWVWRLKRLHNSFGNVFSARIAGDGRLGSFHARLLPDGANAKRGKAPAAAP